VTGKWRKLHKEELNDLYSSPNIKWRIMRWACRTYGERRDVYRDLVRKPGGKKQLGRPKRRWEY
jgi:hypothetical protein